MLIAVLVLAAATAALLFAVVTQRRSVHGLNQDLERRTAELDQACSESAALAAENADLVETQAELADAGQALSSRLAEAETNQTDIESRLTSSLDQVCDLEDELDAADRLAQDQSAELASMAIESEDQTKRIDELDRLLEAAGGSTKGIVDPRILWMLELTRSERTWRYSVAIQPDDPSPFAACSDPLRLAVETEASALCDEVGAFLTVQWDASQIDHAASAHLVLRVAQEMLSQASRIDEPTVLLAENDNAGNVVLRLLPADEGEEVVVDLRTLRHEAIGGDGQVEMSEVDAAVTVLVSA